MSYTFEPVKSPYAEALDKWFGAKNCLYEYNPGKCVLPLCFSKYAQQILDAEVREDDVWLVSFPRAGSTWCQEISWLIGNNLNFEAASSVIQQLRAPMIEISMYYPYHEDFCKLIGNNSVDFVDQTASPRFIKSHLPYDLLPKQLKTVKPKIIYIARNPKDVCASYYPHLQVFQNMQHATFDDMAEYFMKGKLPLGSIWDHFLPFWKLRDEPNVFFLKYEDLKLHTQKTIRRIADFLGKSLTEKQAGELESFLSIKKMQENPGMNMEWLITKCRELGHNNCDNGFIGKKREDFMSNELSVKFDEWTERNSKESGLTFS